MRKYYAGDIIYKLGSAYKVLYQIADTVIATNINTSERVRLDVNTI